ncbi:hypothetical protein SEEM1594_09616 [Salmonella enterica subsp. enterica serovar Muenchen str. baa1594]|nr:hypothetical protein SEEM1594_09616 [Salmonella enterica subsp. enterica serovar Muenchen str. baa1594]
MHVMATTDASSVEDSIGKFICATFMLGIDDEAKNVSTFIISCIAILIRKNIVI